MVLITPEYAELNKTLHESGEKYGVGSFRWAQQVSDLRDELGAETVLDYGCGKGTLGFALGRPEWFSEYDPAIPGKDAEPEHQVDLVVCTDVLEHVEISSLAEVLEHLRHLAKLGMFVSIATQPSSNTLADGRNAHLIVRDAAWWRAQLERYFKVISWSATDNEIIAVLRRLHLLGDIKVQSAVSETIRFEQSSRNCGIYKRRLKILPRNDKRAVVVGYAPSLEKAVPEIAAEQKLGATVVTVSGAHDYLIERGVIPDIHMDCDPRETKAHYTRNPRPDIKYWIASCCHPKLVDNLAGYDLTLWHVLNSNEDYRIVDEIDRDGFLVQGGGSVGCRAVNVMFTQGYRSFSCYAMDCSFGENEEQHAGEHLGRLQKVMLARCGDRWFKTSGSLVAIARGFIENASYLEQVCALNDEPKTLDGYCTEMLIHGDGLLVAMARGGIADTVLMGEAGDQEAA